MSCRVAGVALAMIMGALSGCTAPTHEQHLRSDAEICGMLGHPQGSSEYGVCMKALNKRRCEDRGNRDPMCQQI